MRTCPGVKPTGSRVPKLANSYSSSKTPCQMSLLFTVTFTDHLIYSRQNVFITLQPNSVKAYIEIELFAYTFISTDRLCMNHSKRSHWLIYLYFPGAYQGPQKNVNWLNQLKKERTKNRLACLNDIPSPGRNSWADLFPHLLIAGWFPQRANCLCSLLWLPLPALPCPQELFA